MKIIDAHCHIFPDKIAGKASDAIGNFYDLPMYAPASVAALLTSGATIGAELFLVSSAATTPEQTYSINDFISGQCKIHKELFGFAAMHYKIPDVEEELDRILSLGLHGIKFHNDFQTYDIDEPKAIPMYRQIAKRGIPVLFHMGDDRHPYTTPQKLANVMKQVPDLKCIAAHFGGYTAWDVVARDLPKSENLRFDTSSSLMFLAKEKALGLIDHYGADKFFFGTDFPMWEPREELKRFKNLGLSAAEEEMIFHQNFENFFEL